MECIYLYLLSPLHTGGTTQEGNLVGIARESHTELPYIPSSTIRGRLRASETDDEQRNQLFGTELVDSQELEQGDIWVGDASLLWIPVPSLSHGVVWISSPLLLRRWKRFTGSSATLPPSYACNFHRQGQAVHLKDAVLQSDRLSSWQDWQTFVPRESEIDKVLVLPDQHCATLLRMSLWQQVKIKLDEHKSVEGRSLRFEEAIPPDTLMYFPWGTTVQADGTAEASRQHFRQLVTQDGLLQIGGQESLGRGFVEPWSAATTA